MEIWPSVFQSEDIRNSFLNITNLELTRSTVFTTNGFSRFNELDDSVHLYGSKGQEIIGSHQKIHPLEVANCRALSGRQIILHQVVVSNMFYVHPYLGKVSNLTNIFQMGWFNHQLGLFFTTSGKNLT